MSRLTSSIVVAAAVWLGACLFATLRADSPQTAATPAPPRAHATADVAMFAPSSDCLACHNNLVTPSGEDVSIGASWRGIDDGELRPRPVRAGERPARDDRPCGARRGHRGRVRDVSRAGGAEDRARGRREGADLRAPGQRRGRHPKPARRRGGGRRVVHGLPSDRARPARHAGELQRQLRGGAATPGRPPPRVRPVRGGRRPPPPDALGDAASSRSRRRTSASRSSAPPVTR